MIARVLASEAQKGLPLMWSATSTEGSLRFTLCAWASGRSDLRRQAVVYLARRRRSSRGVAVFARVIASARAVTTATGEDSLRVRRAAEDRVRRAATRGTADACQAIAEIAF